ncbi:MAG: hypothetical protein LBB47_05985 [Spirochaetaceae bacterium]|jgi:hypothetical protein|nr:hypothetical protein [Spirochaetaceae bacterium]
MKRYKSRIRVIVTYAVLCSLIVSAVYAIAGIVLTAMDKTPLLVFFGQERDYGLMLLQCLLGLVVLFLPGLLERRCKVVIENFVYIFFVAFLYAAIILGEVHDFYYKVPHWDTLLHACSGVMLGAIGVSAIDILNNSKKVKLNLSAGFMALFSFFFAVALGAVWEIYEYSMDLFFGFNMQRYKMENGGQLLGQLALYDTMKDLIVDVLGAAAICTIGYIMIKQKNKKNLKLVPAAGLNSPQKLTAKVNKAQKAGVN